MNDNIELVLSNLDFEKFYRERIDVKGNKSGDELHGLCPFHDDKVMSFSVNV